jgi:hypothetical protein
MTVALTETRDETQQPRGWNLRLLGALSANVAAWGLIGFVVMITI